VHCQPGIADHRLARGLEQAVMALPSARDRLLLGVGRRLRQARQKRLGKCVHVREKSLVLTPEAEGFFARLLDACGKAFFCSNEVLLPRRDLLRDRVPNKRGLRREAAVMGNGRDLFGSLLGKSDRALWQRKRPLNTK
jgi:hypothetical protein